MGGKHEEEGSSDENDEEEVCDIDVTRVERLANDPDSFVETWLTLEACGSLLASAILFTSFLAISFPIAG